MEGRRLPSWMSAPPGKGETCKSKSSSATVSRCKDNAVSAQEKEAEAKELTVNLLPGNEGERKRGKRKLLERGCSDAITKERKKAGDTAAPSKTTMTRRRKQSRRRPPSPSLDDDDDEIACNSDVGNKDDVELTLTEEDLLSIANEYIAAAVAANEDSKIVAGEAEEEKKKQVGGTDTSSEFPPPTKEEEAEAAAALERSNDEEKKASTAAAGEDMLNLLLGNLLTKNVLEDVSNNEYMKKEQLKVSQSTTTATVTNDAALPITSFANKKKSSLKDKVTMFLS